MWTKNQVLRKSGAGAFSVTGVTTSDWSTSIRAPSQLAEPGFKTLLEGQMLSAIPFKMGMGNLRLQISYYRNIA